MAEQLPLNAPTAPTTLMRVSDDWPAFKRLFAKAYPKKGDQIDLNLDF